MIRNKIFEAIRERLAQRAAEVKHVDFWNQNVAFIEQETGWERPAVFVEFTPIEWQALREHRMYRGRGTIRLHVVTDWNAEEDTETAFRMAHDVAAALIRMEGAEFGGVELLETHTNHDHEELMESIEVLSVRMTRAL